ncbi:related to MMT1-Mitochondrial iron transport protein [Serendipita indica DSM 11827]|uniref:Related to MMT1-Mitochondrial iron transport protein n=1 Tax=Serendipita indica (strain DSM 11827) TaxID=1109443 RepID=G4TGV7_SERID|nr:related to MMT1-Mitochondrial iron transport protein [Serendipita indica DSM 11827]
MSNVRKRSSKQPSGSTPSTGHEENVNGHSHSHGRGASISSSLLHSHTHGHDGEDEEEEHTGEALMLLDALRGRGDAASRVTLVGLGANIGLTLLKGGAGWYLNSAALIADAGHSLSDLIADFVTLSTIILSQRPASPLYPIGFGKFESLGTVTVSIFLLLGGIGIGAHSWSILSDTLSSTLAKHPNLPPLFIHILSLLLQDSSSSSSHHHGHSHGHNDGDDLSPSAIFFPLFGMLVKEYLYRATKRVAEETNSSVLMANALHHRSDAFASIVTVVAILGSVVMKDIPVDPMGGLLVAFLILLSSVRIFKGAIFELTDASVSPSTLETYRSVLAPLVSTTLVKVDRIRAIRSGSLVFVDVHVTLRSGVSGDQVLDVIEGIQSRLCGERKEVREVRVSFELAAA